MTVELPGNLLVSGDIWIEVIESTPVIQRRAFTGDRLQMPINWITKAEIAKSEQTEAPLEYLFRLGDRLSFTRRPSPSKFGSGG